jgi:hypothetical protein
MPSRIILNINIGIGNARGGAGMIRCGAPRAFQQFHCAEFLNRYATPVSRRTNRLQATLALTAVLIAQHSKFSLLIPPQAVWTKLPMLMIVHSGYRTSVFYRCPDETIDILDRLNCTKGRTHTFRISVA